MAKSKFMAPVESLSGKLGKASKVVFNQRNKVNNAGERINFTSLYRKPTGDPTANQTAWRTLFAQIAAAVKVRKLAPTKAATDAVNFANQSRYKTMYAYLWHLCKEEIENE